MEKLSGFLKPALVYTVIFALYAGMPGRWVVGYVTGKDSNKLRYRLNGLLVLITIIICWALLCSSGVIPWDWFYQYRWYSLAGAITCGMIFTFIMVLPYKAVRNSFLTDFFLGRLENPQLYGGRIDAKMWLYMAGAIMLELNILSFTIHHYQVYGFTSPAIYLSAALLTIFVIDYLTFEEVHLYTYDFLAERVGFKLGWGCTAFYPYFYSIPIWTATDLPDEKIPAFALLIYILIFLAGWAFSRGANLQKYFFKKDPERVFLGIAPKTITDGNNTLLVNGFWGLSRHINYLGEIGMATGIVLCAGHTHLLLPWLYPLYYVVFLLTRQYDDDKRCALKYGELWEQYVKIVPYKIIPYIY
jgi:protein-S-isoprenylcysteine O-methyltransferase Ste14